VKDPLIVGLAAGKLVLLQRKAARQKMQKNKTKQKNRKSSPISTSLRRFQREKESLISVINIFEIIFIFSNIYLGNANECNKSPNRGPTTTFISFII